MIKNIKLPVTFRKEYSVSVSCDDKIKSFEKLALGILRGRGGGGGGGDFSIG